MVSEPHDDLVHVLQALRDLYDDDITPVDVRVAAEALDEVIASTLQAGLVADDVPLRYETIVNDSFTAGQ